MTSTGEDPYWDPIDPEVDVDPYPVWRRLRDEVPLYYNDRYDFWALSRYADVQAAHADPRTFISGKGTVLELMGRDMSMAKGLIIFLDPPEHDLMRALVSRAFTPKRVAALEGRIRDLCASSLDPHVGGAGFDYVGDFAARLPSQVISMLLGVPPSEREEVRGHIDTLFHMEPGEGMVNDVSAAAQLWLVEYIGKLVRERRKRPREDLLSALTQAEITDPEGRRRRLDDEEATGFGNMLISAGTETVGRLLGWAAVVLAAHPDQRGELATDHSLVPAAIEELLRYEAPSPVQGRTTSRDVELHGRVVPAGSKVLLLTGSAGRDERKYEDPDRFDIHRKLDGHLSFGFGIHFCLGAALARLEARVALEETLARFPEWEVDLTRSKQQHTSTVRGWHSVQLVL